MLESLLIKITVKRLEKKFSQSYMASQLNISQSHYNKIENGKTELYVKTLLKIADILEIDKIELSQKQTANNKTTVTEFIPKTVNSFVYPSAVEGQETSTK